MSTTTTTTELPSSAPITFEDDRTRPLPKVMSFDHTSVSHDEIIASLKVAGGCIIRNAIKADTLAQIEKDSRYYIEASKTWEGGFFPAGSSRVSGLAGKSKVFLEEIVSYKPYQDVCNTLLSSTMRTWVGEELHVATSNPQLNNTVIFSIAPGAAAQGLHRDDMIHHNPPKRMRAEDYQIGQDVGVGLFVGGKKTTRVNGATRFIPGSHLWDNETPPDESLTFYAELNPGDAFIMLSSCYHGGSANMTQDEERLVYSCFMTKGFLRQEENQYLNNDPEMLKKFYDDKMLELIGYNLSAPFLGWITEGHPLAALGRARKLGDMY